MAFELPLCLWSSLLSLACSQYSTQRSHIAWLFRLFNIHPHFILLLTCENIKHGQAELGEVCSQWQFSEIAIYNYFHLHTSCNKKIILLIIKRDRKVSSVVKSACSYKGLLFDYHHSHGNSRPSVTPVLRDLNPSSVIHVLQAWTWYTDIMPAKCGHTHTQNIKLTKF